MSRGLSRPKSLMGRTRRFYTPGRGDDVIDRSARAGEPERRHLFAVADQKHIADENRVIPGLALDCRDPRDLRVLVWRGR